MYTLSIKSRNITRLDFVSGYYQVTSSITLFSVCLYQSLVIFTCLCGFRLLYQQLVLLRPQHLQLSLMGQSHLLQYPLVGLLHSGKPTVIDLLQSVPLKVRYIVSDINMTKLTPIGGPSRPLPQKCRSMKSSVCQRNTIGANI